MAAGPDAPRRLARAIGAYADAMAREGGFTPEALEIALAARIVFIPKRDGSLRPLGVVGLLRRIVTRAAATRILRGWGGTRGVLPYLVSRGQFGAGAPAGVEALAHFAQAAIDRGACAACGDRRAAYSLLHPDAVRAVSEGLAPPMAPLVHNIMHPARVFADGVGEYLWSGLFMGDGLSAVLYALGEEGLQETARPRLCELDATQAGFLDDKIVVASMENIREAFETAEAASARGGQVTNLSKCFVLAPAHVADDLRARWPGMRVESVGARVVGVPVGTPAFVAAKATECITTAALARRAVLNALSAQQGFYLLRVAQGWPKVQHVLRGTPAHLSVQAANTHDAGVLEDFAVLAGEPSRAHLATLPLAEAVSLPLRLGGLQLTSASRLRGVAAASAAVQKRRLLDTAFPPAPLPPGTCPPLFLPRPPGRPGHVSRWEMGAAGECSGPARCHMPEEPGCANHCCSVCCMLVGKGLRACAHCLDRAVAAERDLETEMPGFSGELKTMVAASVEAFAAPPRPVWLAFALAARAAQPQRAITCALNGFARERLAARLPPHRLRALEAAGEFPAYAWLLAAPIGDYSVPDVVFACAMRMRLGAGILDPRSVICRTLAGGKPRSCTLQGVARGDADAHALSCKCGGHSISTHNYVRSCLSARLRTWGLTVSEESHEMMAGPAGLKMDIVVQGAGAGRHQLAIDLTRRFNAGTQALEQAEREKETKYSAVYMIPLTIRGFAFSEFGACGSHACDVAARVVNAAARQGAGDPADLSLEFWATFGVALARATAARFAHFARLNRDRSLHAPQASELAPGSFRRVTGASYMCPPPRRHGAVARPPRLVALAVWPAPRRLLVPPRRPGDAAGRSRGGGSHHPRGAPRGSTNGAGTRLKRNTSAPSGARGGVTFRPVSPFVSLVSNVVEGEGTGAVPLQQGITPLDGVSVVDIRRSSVQFNDDDYDDANNNQASMFADA